MWSWDYFTIKLLEQFVALVGHVAWPVAAILIVWMLRTQIGELFQRIRRARWGDGEVSFEEKKEEVERAIVSANNQSDFVTTIAAWDKDPFTEDPETMVRVAWGRIESKIDSLLKEKMVSFPEAPTFADKVQLLEKSGAASSKTVRSIWGVYQLKNLAEGMSGERLDMGRAREFAILADAALYALTIDSNS